MAESSKMNETVDDLDLEDGEIESDNDDIEIVPVEDTNIAKQTTNKNPFAQDPKSDASLTSNTRDSEKGAEDDWMGDVENAIALALQKNGIDPPNPRLQIRSSNDNGKKFSEPEHQSSKVKKRKRRRLEKDLARKEELKKKLKMVEEQIDAKPDIGQSDDLDEYEMLCIRGGSPPPISHSLITSKNTNSRIDEELYYSDDSYSSYDSYEDRLQKRRAKDRRSGRSKRDSKRRRDDSDDERHDKRGPRKLELCKFYLMECCAKRDKCLYLHGDFPCKYYYLGMKNHDQDNCKFSHGKPLSDQMRNILLKHLETAPKEILGDFPRLKTDTAHNMLHVQHQKLLKVFGMDVPTTNTNSTTNPRIPSLMEVATKQPKMNADSLQQLHKHIEKNQPAQYNEQFNKKDSNEMTSSPLSKTKPGKARKTRWCDTGPSSHQQQLQVTQKKLLSHQPNSSNLPKSNPNATTTTTESYLSLKFLSGVITTEQIEKLTSIGIENIDQMNLLTVGQLNEMGLSVGQISEIQLNALNMQKLGLTKKPSSTTTSFSSNQTSTINHSDDSEMRSGDLFYTDFGGGGKDLDMRITQVTPVTSVPSKLSTVCNQDIDMRILPTQSHSAVANCLTIEEDVTAKSPVLTISTIASPDHQSIQPQSNVVTALLPPVPPITSSPVMSMLSKAQNNTMHQSIFSETCSNETSSIFNDNQKPIVIDYTKFLNKSQADSQDKLDYSQYLKDSNIDLEKTNLEDLNSDEIGDDETNDLVVIEDEPTLQIDESWCSNDEDSNSGTNNETSIIYEEMDICNDESTNNSSKSSDMKEVSGARLANDNLAKKSALLPSSVDLNILSDLGRFNRHSYTDSSYTTESPLPAVFDKYTLPANKMEKIDVGKYLTQDDQKTEDDDDNDNEDDDYEIMSSGIDDALTDLIVGKDRRDFSIHDPRNNLSSIVEKVTKELQNKQQPFEFFTRHIPETSHPTPESLDVKSESTSVSKHRSIYESSRSPSRSDDCTGRAATKDKDMRLSSLFLDDMSNGDVDFRLPFKPANFLPATEIDGSEASHAHIEYKVHEVDIPKPNFNEIRRSINQTFDEILDPRLRKIFSQRSSEPAKFSSPEPAYNAIKSEPATDFASTQRIDPRRRNNNNEAANESSNVLAVATNTASSSNPDVQTILQTSDWYKNLSSKQKIMANQQLAHLSGVLKKFHSDSTPNKIFDLSIVMQNPLLGQVLTNLGIYIDENGQFVKFTQTNQQSPIQQQQHLSNNMDFGGMGQMGSVNMGMGVDMMNLPVMGMVGGVLNQDFNQSQMGVGMLQQQPPNTMGRYMGSGPAGMPMPLRGPTPNFMADVRPGLLGVAPGIPYNIFDGQRHGGPSNVMFDRNQGMGGGGGYDHNFSNFDANENGRFPGRFEPMQPDRRNRMENDRWSSRGGRNCGNNRNNQNSLRRNINYDRRTKKN